MGCSLNVSGTVWWFCFTSTEMFPFLKPKCTRCHCLKQLDKTLNQDHSSIGYGLVIFPLRLFGGMTNPCVGVIRLVTLDNLNLIKCGHAVFGIGECVLIVCSEFIWVFFRPQYTKSPLKASHVDHVADLPDQKV